jgi:hypothetical protein
MLWDIKPQFVLHRRHIWPQLRSFLGGDYEEFRIRGCYVVWLL